MSVEFGTEPPGSRVALENGLKALNAGPTPATQSHIAAVKGAQTPPPLPVYSLKLDDIIAARQLPGGDPVAWKYLIIASQQPVRTAEVVPDPANPQKFTFASISSGSAAAIALAIKKAESDKTIANGRYEMRFVQVSSLYVSALWLKDLNGNADYYSIIPPAPRGLVAHVVVSSTDFYKKIQHMAVQKRGVTPQQNPTSPTN